VRWIAVTALDDQERVVVAFVGRQDEGVTVTEDWNVIGQRAGGEIGRRRQPIGWRVGKRPVSGRLGTRTAGPDSSCPQTSG
jgi:alkylation response protein AidB-like acyl-CoA dehydrogenase